MPILGSTSSGGMKPTTPTIGTASDGGTGTTVSVDFTPSTYIGKGTITYTATSSPDSLTGTGSSSPITVSGLTTGTAYTFTVAGNTNYGVSSNSSAASNSVTPASPSSYESIATFNGTGSSGVISFTSIPQTYKHLQLRCFVIGSVTNGEWLRIKLNGVTTGYNYSILYGSATTVNAYTYTNQSSMVIGSLGVGLDTTYPIVSISDIIDYTNTSKIKTVKSSSGAQRNSSSGGDIGLYSGDNASTNAITSIDVLVASGNFATTTKIALYGIKG